MYSHYIILCFYLESFLLLVVANEEETRQFFNDALRCILEIQRGAPDGFSQDRLYMELEDYARTLSAFLSVPSFVNEPSNIHCIRSLRGLYECFRCLLREYQPLQQTENICLVPPTIMTRSRGRPQYRITADQITHCLSLGMNWGRVASCLGINRRTLYRHRQYLRLPPLHYTTISNEDLNALIVDILQQTPNSGEVYVQAGLRCRGIRIQCWRVRQSLYTIDPIGRSLRRRHAIRRRTYDVRNPNQLW